MSPHQLPPSSESPELAHRCARVFLECGADSASLDSSDIERCPSGINLMLPWQFEIGTCLRIRLSRSSNAPFEETEAMVIDCEPLETQGRYRLSLLFLSLFAVREEMLFAPEWETSLAN